MAREYFGSDGGAVNETGTRQYFGTGGAAVNETISSGATIATTTGTATADGSTATIESTATINTTTGTATADGSTATVTNDPTGVTINTTTGAATAAGSTAAVSQFIMSSVFTNNTSTPLATQAVSWTWLPAWRIGDALPTPVHGSGTTDGSGQLTTTIPHAEGVLLSCVRNTNARDDFVYYEAFA